MSLDRAHATVSNRVHFEVASNETQPTLPAMAHRLQGQLFDFMSI